MDYAEKCLNLSKALPARYQFNIGDQLVRAALSIPNNIAEGNGRRSTKESQNFYNIAKGSAYETVTILELSRRQGLVTDQQYREAYSAAEEICRMLSGLMATKVV